MDSPGHVVYIQYAGDFRDALRLLDSDQPETYFAQKYSVGEVVRIARNCRETTVVCCQTQSAYDCRDRIGVRTIGMGITEFTRSSAQDVIRLCRSLQPTHAIVRFPNWRILHWLVGRDIRVLALFANSIGGHGARGRLSRYLLAKALKSPRVSVIANHQVNSCRSIARLGVDPGKILPYDFPMTAAPDEQQPKSHPGNRRWLLLYCGTVIESKGVKDILEAVAILRSLEVDVSLEVLGEGELQRFRGIAAELGIAEVCHFAGQATHSEVMRKMREASIVLVPSHHSYMEGLPFTIREALTVRTPLIVSNHPMFSGVMTDRLNGLVVPEKSPQLIAEAVTAYMMEPGLYEAVSHESALTAARNELPLQWGDLVEKWLDGSPEAMRYLFSHSLANRSLSGAVAS